MERKMLVVLMVLGVVLSEISLISCERNNLRGKYFVADLDYLPLYKKDLLYISFNITEKSSGEKVGDKYMFYSQENRLQYYEVKEKELYFGQGITPKGKIRGDSIYMKVRGEDKVFKMVNKKEFDKIIAYYVDGKNVNFK